MLYFFCSSQNLFLVWVKLYCSDLSYDTMLSRIWFPPICRQYVAPERLYPCWRLHSVPSAYITWLQPHHILLTLKMEAVCSYEMQEPQVLCCWNVVCFWSYSLKLVIVLQVTYGRLRVNLGNELTPTQVKDIPAVRWTADSGSYYLLVMTGLFFSALCFNTLHFAVFTMHCLTPHPARNNTCLPFLEPTPYETQYHIQNYNIFVSCFLPWTEQRTCKDIMNFNLHSYQYVRWPWFYSRQG
jgi:hypothetical protein